MTPSAASISSSRRSRADWRASAPMKRAGPSAPRPRSGPTANEPSRPTASGPGRVGVAERRSRRGSGRASRGRTGRRRVSATWAERPRRGRAGRRRKTRPSRAGAAAADVAAGADAAPGDSGARRGEHDLAVLGAQRAGLVQAGVEQAGRPPAPVRGPLGTRSSRSGAKSHSRHSGAPGWTASRQKAVGGGVSFAAARSRRSDVKTARCDSSSSRRARRCSSSTASARVARRTGPSSTAARSRRRSVRSAARRTSAARSSLSSASSETEADHADTASTSDAWASSRASFELVAAAAQLALARPPGASSAARWRPTPSRARPATPDSSDSRRNAPRRTRRAPSSTSTVSARQRQLEQVGQAGPPRRRRAAPRPPRRPAPSAPASSSRGRLQLGASSGHLVEQLLGAPVGAPRALAAGRTPACAPRRPARRPASARRRAARRARPGVRAVSSPIATRSCSARVTASSATWRSPSSSQLLLRRAPGRAHGVVGRAQLARQRRRRRTTR